MIRGPRLNGSLLTHPDPWLNNHVDFRRAFLGGDSAGANIAHNMGIRVGSENLNGINIVGMCLIHPYFWGEKQIDGETDDINVRSYFSGLWRFVNPNTSGLDDPLINPALDPKLSSLGCSKVLVCVAENDGIRKRGWYYCELLGKSEWGGKVEVFESKGEGHVFHLFNPTGENAVAMTKTVASFLNDKGKI